MKKKQLTKILIVEDENIVAIDIKNSLKSLGYGISGVVASGENAILKVAEKRPDLVLVDILLKDKMDGIEAAEQIRNRFNVPVVYLTAFADDKTLQRAKITEPYGYILKPFEERELHTTIEMALYKHQIESKLKEHERWLNTTLISIGDAVIATDKKGFVIFMNPIAEDLCGWTQEQAIGKDLNTVFRIINEKTRKSAISPVKKALRKGVIVGLSNHSILIAKNGSEIPIDDSAAPIKDDHGNITGVVLVFRDITNRRQAETALQKAHDELEHRVIERTAELSNANIILKKEIAERKKAEDALRQSEERYRLLFNSGNDAVFVHGIKEKKTANFIEVNEIACKRLGYTRDELLRLSTADINSPDELNNIPVQMDKLFSKKHVLFNRIHLSKTGDRIPVEINAHLFVLKGEAMVLSVARDITERKRAEDALRQSEERYRSLVENAKDIIFTISPEGIISSLNPAFETITGWSCNDLIGKKFEQLFHPDDLPLAIENLKHIMAGSAVPMFELRIITKSGNYLLTEYTLTPQRKNKKIVAALGIARDVSERLQAEQEIRRFKTILDNANFGVCIVDIDGNIVTINKYFAETHGYKQDEVINKNLEIFHNKEQLQLVNLINQNLLKNGSYHAREVWHKHKDGSVFLMLMNGVVIKDETGNPKYIAASAIDITINKRMEDELLQSRKLESIGILAGGIAHDFNNILTAILGNVSLAKMFLNPGDKIYKRITEAEKASLRAKELTKQLLTFAQGGSPVRKTTSIAELIKDTAAFALRGANVKCQFNMPKELWKVEIDEGQINQVIHNVILNADQAMLNGGIISVTAENVTVGDDFISRLKSGKYVKISIEDYGIGIPEKIIQKIFDPYFTTKQDGTGLGLATSFSIVNKHDGYIDVQSKEGEGAAFFIYLPASLKKTHINKVIEKTLRPGKGKILIMDDDKMVLDTAGQMLSDLGYEVNFAKDGFDALEQYQKSKASDNPFDLVIMDLTIPGGLGGIETIKKLHKINPEAKAIVSSGYSTAPVMANFEEYGFSGVVAKPYDVKELSEIIEHVLTC